MAKILANMAIDINSDSIMRSIRIEDNGLGFYFIFFHFLSFSSYFLLFFYFLLKKYKTKKTKCDTVTEVICSHDTKKDVEGSGTR